MRSACEAAAGAGGRSTPSPRPHPLHPLTLDAGPAKSSPAVGHRPWTWRTRGIGGVRGPREDLRSRLGRRLPA